MKLAIKHKYLIFPVNTMTTKKTLTFSLNDETVYKLNIKLDNCNPDFYAHIDVSRFIGQTLDILVSPEMKLAFSESDEMEIDNLYHEPMRPQVHFTAKNGWINDPNGLVYIDGTYHLFYQHNPTAPNWDNMHWGHAESKDLIHWEEKAISLFPDERGTMFSGCAILDENNLLGKNDGDKKAALLFYTTTNPFCQNISYSTDNFKTVHKYEDNPIVSHIKARNRDPKVTFCDELACYIMILYLTEGIYCIFRSDDLKKWVEIQQIHLVGDRECPDIFPLCDVEGNRRWVIMGASDKYLVGKFENGNFVPVQDVMTLHYGSSAYAGQSFNSLPDGRIVRMVWNRWEISSNGFNGQMGIPMELSLAKSNDIYYLEANPVEELKSIYNDVKCFENIKLSPNEQFNVKLEDSPYIFKIKSDYINSGNITFSAFGRNITIDFSKNEIKLGNCTAPVSITKNGFDLTIISDRCSIEIFADGGKAYMSCLSGYTFMDRNLPCFSIISKDKQNIKSVEVISLKSIWK